MTKKPNHDEGELTPKELEGVSGGVDPMESVTHSAPVPERDLAPPRDLKPAPKIPISVSPRPPPPDVDRVELQRPSLSVTTTTPSPTREPATTALRSLLGNHPRVETMSIAAQNVVQNEIARNPAKMAQTILTRAQAFLDDTQSWWSMGGNKGTAQKVLTEIIGALKNKNVTDPEQLWKQLQALNALEHQNSKIPLVDALVSNHILEQAKALGIESNDLSVLAKQKAAGHFDVNNLSKDQNAKVAHQKALESFSNTLLTRTFRELVGDALNPMQALIKKDPKTAWNVMTLHARALCEQLVADNIHHDNLLRRNQYVKDVGPGAEDIADEKFENQKNIAQALQDRLKNIEAIELSQHYSLLSDTAIGVARGEIPITQIKPRSDAKTWAAWALSSQINSARQSLDAATQIPFSTLVEQRKATRTTQTARDSNDLWVLDNFKDELKRNGHPTLVRDIESAVKAARTKDPSAALGDVVKGVVDKYTKQFSSSSVSDKNTRALLEKGLKTYQDGLLSSWSLTPTFTPGIMKTAMDGALKVAKAGKLDNVLSLEGLSNSVEALNDFTTEVQAGPKKNLSAAQQKREIETMNAQYEQNLNNTVDKIGQLLIPESGFFNWIKRYFLKSSIKSYYLKEFANQIVDKNKHDVFLASAVKNIRLLKGTNLGSGNPLEQMHQKLAFSKLVGRIVDQLTSDKKPTASSPERAGQMAQQLQRLLGNVDLDQTLNIDPNSWSKTAMSWLQYLDVPSMVTSNSDKEKAKTAALKSIADLKPHVSMGFDLDKLTALVGQHKISDAKAMVNTQIERLKKANPNDPNISRWQTLLTNLDKYGQVHTGLSETVQIGHKQIVEKLARWLQS